MRKSAQILATVVPVQKTYLSKRELCKYMDVSEDYVDNLIKNAKIGFCQISDRKYLFRKTDVDRYIERFRIF